MNRIAERPLAASPRTRRRAGVFARQGRGRTFSGRQERGVDQPLGCRERPLGGGITERVDEGASSARAALLGSRAIPAHRTLFALLLSASAPVICAAQAGFSSANGCCAQPSPSTSAPISSAKCGPHADSMKPAARPSAATATRTDAVRGPARPSISGAPLAITAADERHAVRSEASMRTSAADLACSAAMGSPEIAAVLCAPSARMESCAASSSLPPFSATRSAMYCWKEFL